MYFNKYPLRPRGILLYNCVKIITLKKFIFFTMLWSVYNVSFPIVLVMYFQVFLFFKSKIQSRSIHCMYSHISLVSFNLEVSSVSFHPSWHWYFQSTLLVVLHCVPQFGFVRLFPHDTFRLNIFYRSIIHLIPCSCSSPWEADDALCPVTSNIKLDLS